MKYNRPIINIIVGILMSAVLGAISPMLGGIMVKMLFVLLNTTDYDVMRNESNKWCFVMFIITICDLFSAFSSKLSFGVVGENITHNIRKQLFRKILEKHQGWFDLRENAPGQLSSVLARDS